MKLEATLICTPNHTLSLPTLRLSQKHTEYSISFFPSLYLPVFLVSAQSKASSLTHALTHPTNHSLVYFEALIVEPTFAHFSTNILSHQIHASSFKSLNAVCTKSTFQILTISAAAYSLTFSLTNSPTHSVIYSLYHPITQTYQIIRSPSHTLEVKVVLKNFHRPRESKD